MSGRGLVVLADGAQAAFCAGVVAELAASGVRWQEGAGAGLGAVVALLALAEDPEEAARRFARLAEEQAALFAPAVQLAQQRLADRSLLLLPDPWRLSGWLSREVLEEYLAPEQALAGKAQLYVALEELVEGRRGWQGLTCGEQLVAVCAFPWGWGPEGGRWGGVGACGELPWPPLQATAVDLVCGFPVPPVARPGLEEALFATLQRREELAAAATVQRFLREVSGIRLWAPSQESYAAFAQRDNAELGVEYPLPAEQNGELCELLVRYGRWVAAQGTRVPGGRA